MNVCGEPGEKPRTHKEKMHVERTEPLSSSDCLQFYAPWCGYCKKLEPIWFEVGDELKRSGSPVRVGKMDATAYSGECVWQQSGNRAVITGKLQTSLDEPGYCQLKSVWKYHRTLE